MKNLDDFYFAIELLKSAAENDFELHRIEVLENDLLNPPKPVQIDEAHQFFDGDVYSAVPKHVHLTKRTSIHRAVYRYYRGEIPDGYIIHHIDGNPTNNDISNLQCLTNSEHRKIHHLMMPAKNSVCINCGKKFLYRSVGVSARFCSAKCREIYDVKERASGRYETRTCEICGKDFRTRKRNSATTCSSKCAAVKKKKNYIPQKITAVCEFCGKEFLTNKFHPASCCSTHCRTLRDYYTQFETRVCEVCGKEFSCNRHTKTRFCSHSCANKKRSANHTLMTTRVCPICGKEFSCLRTKPTKTCSRRCSYALTWQTRRKKSVEQS